MTGLSKMALQWCKTSQALFDKMGKCLKRKENEKRSTDEWEGEGQIWAKLRNVRKSIDKTCKSPERAKDARTNKYLTKIDKKRSEKDKSRKGKSLQCSEGRTKAEDNRRGMNRKLCSRETLRA